MTRYIHSREVSSTVVFVIRTLSVITRQAHMPFKSYTRLARFIDDRHLPSYIFRTFLILFFSLVSCFTQLSLVSYYHVSYPVFIFTHQHRKKNIHKMLRQDKDFYMLFRIFIFVNISCNPSCCIYSFRMLLSSFSCYQ
jgi:hypothetical protein